MMAETIAAAFMDTTAFRQNRTQFYSRIYAIALKQQKMKIVRYYGITNHTRKLAHLYHPIF